MNNNNNKNDTSNSTNNNNNSKYIYIYEYMYIYISVLPRYGLKRGLKYRNQKKRNEMDIPCNKTN